MMQSMGGWKVKTGSFLTAIGVVIAGSAEVVPIDNFGPWLKFAGFLFGGIGSAFVTWGIGHKIEKSATGIENAYVLDQKCADIISE
jgi:hypothetical protein